LAFRLKKHEVSFESKKENSATMKTTRYYLSIFFGFGIGVFIYSILFGEFYPVLESFFESNTSSSHLFEQIVNTTDWPNTLLKPMVIASFATVFQWIADKTKVREK